MALTKITLKEIRKLIRNRRRRDDDQCFLNMSERDFRGLNLEKLKILTHFMHRIDFSGSDFRGVSFWGGPNFKESVFEDVNFEGTRLGGAYWGDAKFVSANLRKADFGLACFGGADFTSANLEGADLSDANLCRAIFCDANLMDVQWTGERISERARIEGADFRGAKFDQGAILKLWSKAIFTQTDREKMLATYTKELADLDT
ncbi:MAG: pentapeptide repeat-containing protein [bacterium]|nr:pentapeptide repeat-containing protein [bacterium]